MISSTMRLWLILAVLALCCGLALAQDKPVQTFNGSTAFTTPAFQVQDRWEVRYDSPGVLSVTVLAADGSVAAGAAGTVKGSLYLPKGGSFTLQVSPGSNGGNAPWHITIVQVGAALTSDEPSNYVPPASAAAPAPDASTSVASAPATNSAPTPTTAPRRHAGRRPVPRRGGHQGRRGRGHRLPRSHAGGSRRRHQSSRHLGEPKRENLRHQRRGHQNDLAQGRVRSRPSRCL